MKTNLFFIAFVAGIFFNANASESVTIFSPWNQKFYSLSPHKDVLTNSIINYTSIPSFPQLVQIYGNYGGEWYHQYNRKIKYNEWNKPATVTTTLASDSSYFSVDTLIYDSNGRLTGKNSYAWDNTWMLANRVCIQYDLDGNKTQEMHLDFSDMPADTTYFEQLHYQNSYISEYYSFMNFFGFKMELKIEFEYLNAMLSEMIFSQTNYMTGSLENTTKYKNIEFEDYTGNYETDILKKADIYEWMDSQWEFSGKMDTEFGEFGSYVRLIQQWTGSHYEDFQKETVEYDSYLNLLEDKTEFIENDEWLIFIGNKYLRTYNNSFLVSCTFQEWDDEQLAYVDLNKEVYSSFLPVGIKEPSFKNSEKPILVSSPGSNILYIRYPENNYNEIQVAIFNFSGEKLYKQTLIPNRETVSLDISFLVSGLYVFEITAGNSRSTLKFVKL